MNVMLTTIDNPFNPFEQFDDWYLFDMEKGYNTCGKLARLIKRTEGMTQKELQDENEKAIDRIIELDFLDLYKKVSLNDTTETAMTV